MERVPLLEVQFENSVDSDDSVSAVPFQPLFNNGGDPIFEPQICETVPFLNIEPPCPDCNIEMTPQYFLEEGHCQPTERQPSGCTKPLRDWKCCNPGCAVQGEFSNRCSNCPTKLLRWLLDGANRNKEHWTLYCPDCADAGRSVKKKARKGAMCGRCVYCKVIGGCESGFL